MSSLATTGCDFYSGWIAGMAGLVVGHPIDTLKVRQQILGKPMLESFANIYRAGGMLTFFRGMGVPLLTTGALNSVYFGFYGSTLDYLSEWRRERMLQQRRLNRSWITENADNNGTASPPSTNRHMNVETYWDYFIAGCVGGAAQLVIGCPVDLVKVQLQSQIQRSSMKGPLDCIVRIIKTNGIFGLYKGFFAQAFRDIPSFGIYVTIYEFLKKKLSYGEVESSKFAQFVAGGIAGTVSWWSIIPLDVIKSRIQGESGHTPKYNGMLHCASVIIKTQGIQGLFRGFWPLSIRAFPVNGTTFLVYEYLFRHCKEYQNSLHL